MIWPHTIQPFFSLVLLALVKPVISDQYEVTNLRCSDGDNRGRGQKLEARLRKPAGFRGYPYFADDRHIQGSTDPVCQIRADPKDTSGLVYRLLVTDFNKCGVGKQNSFTTVRIWFPTLPGLVLMSDQEVMLMCRPAQATVTENRAAGIAGSIPMQGRVSGTVEETAARPEYGVAVYREASARSGNFVMPVDQAVPIGTRLQLKASVNTDSMWKYAKLMEVTVSTDPNNAYQAGFIFLVQKGCRNPEYQTVVPTQPHRSTTSTGDVTLEFEAFLLETMSATDVLWIHTKIKACVKGNDCAPSRCLDLTDPVGFGRKRRNIPSNETVKPELMTVTLRSVPSTSSKPNNNNLTNFSQNVGIKIIPTGEPFGAVNLQPTLVHCNFLLVVTIVLASILFTALVTVVLLACRIHTLLKNEKKLESACSLGTSEWQFSQRPSTRNRFNT